MTKDNIIIAALRLFLLKGYKNVSLIDVAKEVNITKGGIYHYFGSKEVLFHTGISYLFTYFENKYADFFSQQRSFLEILNFMLGGVQDIYIEELLMITPGDYRINNANLTLEIMHNFPEIQKKIDQSLFELRIFLQEKIQMAQVKGEIRQDLAAFDLANIILSVSSGLNILGKQMNTPNMRQQIVANLWQLIAVDRLKG